MKRDAFLWGRFADLRMTPAAAERLCRQAEARRERARSRSAWKTIAILERAGRSWERGPLRREAERLMPRVSGFSPAMVRRSLDILPRLLSRASLSRRLAAELGRGDALDSWSLDPEGRCSLKAFPLGSVLHVAAGNIFLGCVDSVVMSLLTRNVTLLRLSAADRDFPLLFAKSLLRADPAGELASTLAVVHWPSGDEAVESVFKKRLQAVVVWGGAEAVAAYGRGLGAGCRLIAFGPKLSFAVITRKGLSGQWAAPRGPGGAAAARRAALDIALWDQMACASPQTLFVEDPAPRDFLAALARELGDLDRSLPPGPLSRDSAADLVEHRHRAVAAELQGRGRLLASQGPGWTVAWRKGGLAASPLNRFIHVRPYRGLADLLDKVRPFAPYLQSAGLLAAPGEAAAYAEALTAAGLARVPELGRMLEDEEGAPHDGRYPLRELVRWATGPAEAVAGDAEQGLSSLIEQAREEAPFYRRRLKGRILSRLPLLDKEDLYRHSPPASAALLTRAGEGAGRVLFASGGSTGKPKFCLYTQEEFQVTCRWLAWGLRRSGLAPGDVVANLFVAGNLWSSFMAVEGAMAGLAVTHLPIGGTSEPDFALDAIRRFRANVLIGLPSTLGDLARRASGGRGFAVEKIFYAGEHASEPMVRLWKRSFGARLVRSAGYASVDAGLIGFQCPHCPGSAHHVAAGLQRVEILPDGEIVATNLLRRWMPVIRYRTGDSGRWLSGPCPCRDPAPRFELRGRMDDRVNVGGAHLDVGDVGRAVERIPSLGTAYQVVVGRSGAADHLAVRVERRRSGGDGGGLAERLRRELLACSGELADSVARGWLKVPAVELLPPGGLPRSARTGKLKRVVDLRRP